MPIETTTNLDYLIDPLRMHLGDMDSTKYRYIDSWLRTALVTSVISLQRWWGSKYQIDGTYNAFRDDTLVTFDFAEPPIIQQQDERPIILMAAILIKSGQLENNSWAVGSWRDAEIAVSNIEGSRSKQFGINLDWQELLYYLKPPQKQLFGAERNDPPNDELWYN
jgi:hypothetical protein